MSLIKRGKLNCYSSYTSRNTSEKTNLAQVIIV